MKEIKTVAVLGRGAIGASFGSYIHNALGYNNTYFIVDEERKVRYEKEPILFNGEPYSFHYITPYNAIKADLIILAVKYTAIHQAIEQMAPFIKEDTIIISTLNGIKSEDDLREDFGREKVVRCIAQKMGITYMGNEVIADPIGELAIGAESPIDQDNVDALVRLFEKCNIPFVVSSDIVHDAYSKLMLNCGINQTCAAYDVNYEAVQKEGKLRNIMIETMREVQEVARSEGIDLNEEDFDFWMEAVSRLGPNSMPSMRQDVLAKRKTEIELFGGHIVELAKKHHIQVPHNEYFVERFKEIEKEY